MKLSEKIAALRKVNGMTQEELAFICNVSRQSISKWEADIALPETEKLLILGETFHVSMDVLLKDELEVSCVKAEPGCCSNAVQEKRNEVYEGIPKYWTVLFFTCAERDFPERISKVMLSDPDKGR